MARLAKAAEPTRTGLYTLRGSTTFLQQRGVISSEFAAALFILDNLAVQAITDTGSVDEEDAQRYRATVGEVMREIERKLEEYGENPR